MERNKDAVATKINSINMSTQFFLSDEPLLEMLKRTKDGETFSAEEWYSFKNSDIVSLERLVNNNPLLYGVRVYASNDRVQEMPPAWKSSPGSRRRLLPAGITTLTIRFLILTR